MSRNQKTISITIDEDTLEWIESKSSNKSATIRKLLREARNHNAKKYVELPIWLDDREVENIQKAVEQYLKAKMQAQDNFNLNEVVAEALDTPRPGRVMPLGDCVEYALV